ncbi:MULTISPECIES: sugar phosphate nucleotidyltransferase [unclassified Aureimonas]|uniref:sugar phosphate nucleotidyltransferase n=1 Tax=unclassified Aureimonas TaxID=2615206 RepID=UPI0006F7D2B4|nr:MULTISPECIES: sugar phosphate nucleotidyltransferase [unclassified Aureimonas]KQT56279.1 nucleoside-diphosphate-sugar pyrophosphorylase [Aureimonas sp. Leaf427]KQT65889.1 nucleoside-diphosphate-sugar pyrophosphorylase [Aureimonas sp. Leaf460]
MQAVIMAGGRGTRLGPYTALFPKPLAPLGDEMPVLELLLRQLKSAGVTEVILAVNHLHHLLRAFFGQGESLGLTIRYSLEDKPLGTAGPLAAVVQDLDESFFVANGDLLTTLDFSEMRLIHADMGADVTVGSHKREVKIDFGLLETDGGNWLQSYTEKPTYSHLVSMGLYVMRRDAVAPHLDVGRYLDIPDLLRTMTSGGKRIYCHAPECFWLDIGRPDDYRQAQEIFASSRSTFLKETI